MPASVSPFRAGEGSPSLFPSAISVHPLNLDFDDIPGSSLNRGRVKRPTPKLSTAISSRVVGADTKRITRVSRLSRNGFGAMVFKRDDSRGRISRGGEVVLVRALFCGWVRARRCAASTDRLDLRGRRRASLFRPQSGRRVDPTRTPRRKVAGGQDDHDQERCGEQERKGVCWRDPEQKTGQQTGEGARG